MLTGDDPASRPGDTTPPDAVPTRRWALLIEYDGAGFVGWQRQRSGVSVQAVLEAAAARLFGGRAINSIVAGRTDAGVHAAGQTVQLDLPLRPGLDGFRLREALNFHMKPHAVSVLEAAPAPDDWNARFSAIRRRYRFRILNRAARPALSAGRVWHVKTPLDASRMAAAAGTLLGRHDFSSFRASSCQARSPLRTLDRLDVRRDGQGDEIVVEAEARAFLHHQVRNMVGTLKLVGDGSWPVERVAAALAARDRAAAGPTAPPDGLCLVGVDYPVSPFGRPAAAPD
ncbi:tRNA pseudouridine(38-40) synthase TruA [Rhizosaccharibacter radicis]|uniref:tRNA pseudouridine synthase A n=1 Tax=Rhizosaccharibacter radicis TaxID=2782605 RepID=A0ABT1VVC4_9PROT|nr:tRNA pseudouridine(38-40) synthase TruA [Acetobacteraceae bacterium KSS12]